MYKGPNKYLKRVSGFSCEEMLIYYRPVIIQTSYSEVTDS